MKYMVIQAMICALSSTYWLSSCGKVFDFFENGRICALLAMPMPFISLMGVVVVGLTAPRGFLHLYLGLVYWTLSAFFVFYFI